MLEILVQKNIRPKMNKRTVHNLNILVGIYIPLTLPLKECIQVRTKLSEGQLFTFRDRQDSCLPSAARLDSPEDQGKGKVGPRKVLFLQEYNFLQG